MQGQQATALCALPAVCPLPPRSPPGRGVGCFLATQRARAAEAAAALVLADRFSSDAAQEDTDVQFRWVGCRLRCGAPLPLPGASPTTRVSRPLPLLLYPPPPPTPRGCLPNAQRRSVWALKSYSKHLPLYVQVLRRASVARIAPFLDPARDVVLSVQQTRHRLLALSAMCPGASTLITNLLRSTCHDRCVPSRQPVCGGNSTV